MLDSWRKLRNFLKFFLKSKGCNNLTLVVRRLATPTAVWWTETRPRRWTRVRKMDVRTLCILLPSLAYKKTLPTNLSRPPTLDTLLHHHNTSPPSPSPSPPLISMAKRPCPSSSTSQIPNANASAKQNPSMDYLLETFLDMADSPLSIGLSFDRLIDSTPCDADQSLLIDRALKLGSLLLEAGNRSARKRASKHNSLAWVLPPDLTIKVIIYSLCFSFFFFTWFSKWSENCLNWVGGFFIFFGAGVFYAW